jgi:hypothetical protein
MFQASFDGRSNKRAVSMGGRKVEDKAAVLARATAERAEREVQRKHKLAAAVVQRWWRGRSVAARARNSIREQWDDQITKMETVVNTFQAR